MNTPRLFVSTYPYALIKAFNRESVNVPTHFKPWQRDQCPDRIRWSSKAESL